MRQAWRFASHHENRKRRADPQESIQSVPTIVVVAEVEIEQDDVNFGAKSLAEGILATAREENVKIFKTKDALKGVAHRLVIVND